MCVVVGSLVLTDYNLSHARKTDSTSPFTSSSREIDFNSPVYVDANVQNVHPSIMNSYEICPCVKNALTSILRNVSFKSIVKSEY